MNQDSFSLDQLVIDEETQVATIFPISVLVFGIEFENPIKDSIGLKDHVISFLIDKFPFRMREGRKFKEGFLDFNILENSFKCFYARETPIKIFYENNDLKIHEKRIKSLDPENRVSLNVFFDDKGSKIIVFGSNDFLAGRVRDFVTYGIQGQIVEGFRRYESNLSQNDIRRILSTLDSVEYLWIDPGESEKFIKIVEQRIGRDIKRIPEYLVHSKMRGIRLLRSPIVVQLIEEQGIKIREVQGRFNFSGGKVTIRISTTGRIIFWIPLDIIPKNSTLFAVAEHFYEELMIKEMGYKQQLLREFLQ